MTSPQKPINPNHVLGIDALRFLAAMMVVWYHFAYKTGAYPGGLASVASQGVVAFPSLYDWSYFGWIGVQIFFVISGFVIAYSAEKSTAYSFLVSRVTRLGPAAWICATLSLVAVYLVGFMVQPELMRAFRHSVFFLPWGPWIDGSYWTLGVEISFYAMVLVLIRCNRFEWIRWLAIMLGLVSTLFWVSAAVVGLDSATPLGNQILALRDSRTLDLALIHHGMFFALGVLLWLQLTRKVSAVNIAWSLLFMVGGCLQIAGEANHLNRSIGSSYSALSGYVIFLASIVAIIVAVRINPLIHRAPQWLLRGVKTAGLMTYPVYLLHQVIGSALMGWLVIVGRAPLVALSGTIAMVLLAGWIVAKYIEPPLQWLTRTVFGRSRQILLYRKTAG